MDELRMSATEEPALLIMFSATPLDAFGFQSKARPHWVPSRAHRDVTAVGAAAAGACGGYDRCYDAYGNCSQNGYPYRRSARRTAALPLFASQCGESRSR
jgi:hypothetical protein